MGKPREGNHQIIVETYSAVKSGKSTHIHVRPVPDQQYRTTLDVRCSRAMRSNYPIGTKFRIYAKLTDRTGGGEFLHSPNNWSYDVVEGPKN